MVTWARQTFACFCKPDSTVRFHCDIGASYVCTAACEGHTTWCRQPEQTVVMPQQEHAGSTPVRRASSIDGNSHANAARRLSLSTRPAGAVPHPSSQRRASLSSERSSSSQMAASHAPKAEKSSSGTANSSQQITTSNPPPTASSVKSSGSSIGNSSPQQTVTGSRPRKAAAVRKGRPAGLHQLPELPEDVGTGLKRTLLVVRLAGLALGGFGLYQATRAIKNYHRVYGNEGGKSSLLVYYYCMTVGVALHTSLGAYWTLLTTVPALRQRADAGLFFGLKPYMFEMGLEFFFSLLWLSLFVSLFFLPRTSTNRIPYYAATLGGAIWSLLPAGLIWRLRVLISRAEQQLALLPMAVVRVDRTAAARKVNTIPGAAYIVS